ncbi:unnamed protein product [Closterium sp. NIES-53]
MSGGAGEFGTWCSHLPSRISSPLGPPLLDLPLSRLPHHSNTPVHPPSVKQQRLVHAIHSFIPLPVAPPPVAPPPVTPPPVAPPPVAPPPVAPPPVAPPPITATL